MSWIHIGDLASLVEFALREEKVHGPINAVSPEPVRNYDFVKLLAERLNRPSFFPVPLLALKILIGKMAKHVVSSQRVLPQSALKLGFKFDYPNLGTTFTALLKQDRRLRNG